MDGDSDHPDEETRTDIVAVEAWRTAPVRTGPQAFLVVLSGGFAGRAYRVLDEIAIGRSHTADVQLDDPGISRHHAKLQVDSDGQVTLSDQQSTNGTFCNGVRIAAQKLQDGDKIQVGASTVLKFTYQDALEESLQLQLYDAATRDPLTRVHNKGFLQEALLKEFAYALRHQVPLSLVLLDIDHFKRINDTYGHLIGDNVLQRVSRRVSDALRLEDLLARFGGEEFVVVLRETGPEAASRCAERVRHAVETMEFICRGERLRTTISAGVATLQDGNIKTVDDLLGLADKRLYAAKSSGRNRVQAA